MLKLLFALAALLLLSCGGSPDSQGTAPTISAQQVQCLNKRKDYVQQVVAANKQTFYRMEEDVFLFRTADGRVIGYLFEQGECSAVLTQLASGETAQAARFIADEVKQNRGVLFITPGNVQFKYYTAQQGAGTYLVAASLN